MYTTFEATQPLAAVAEQQPKASNRTAKKPTGTAHACLECRRRKSRCDGAQPCSRCREDAKTHLCVYVAQKQRVAPSRRLVEQLSTSLLQCRRVLDRLFPASDIAVLESLSKKELANLVASSLTPSGRSGSNITNDFVSSSGRSTVPVQSKGSLALEELYETPTEYSDEGHDPVTDDVNALKFSLRRQSSYVGSCSIATALKVIAILCPAVMKNSSLTLPSSSASRSDPSAAGRACTSREQENSYIDAYFNHVHIIVPMVNELKFRQRYEATIQDDMGWLALMNMVLALGAIASETCRETSHTFFYKRAAESLNFDSFGSGNMDIVQALGLMGGLYLHYTNRPNMAVVVTGAALRMALALGLHRGKDPAGRDPQSDSEIKRRTWWSLVCMDTWGSTTLGRPSTGDCFGPAITTLPPSFDDFPDSPVEHKAPILVAAVQFCRLLAQIQSRLSSSACLDSTEALAYDFQLEQQFLALPATLQSPHRCAQKLLIPRAIIKWQNQNAQLLLHRPTLLAAALSRIPFPDLPPQEQESILRCRKWAGETIVDIACDWQPDPMCGWHAVWYLFQAAMVPLVSSFYEHTNASECGKWHSQIEMVLRLLNSMDLWSPAARRTREVIAALHQSATQLSTDMLAGATDLWKEQSPFLFDDEAWLNATWFNTSDWPMFPMETP